ncbi:histidinol-phosphate aminotransferase [Capsulimonas corticalis]|uniref:Histidinol-phosphate aminotransferase n=1 Tax=Capsulimonas corticalis TaxID=2219043 RepID=A0A402D4A0_9BACT|nr:histidinol-phosphate transaminase [Capsulimonas corticalis]BDI31154.1 histidinol-phosphate aminotransferase [Capsulimonas corticalis]
MSLPISEHILALRPYQPGKPIDEVKRELGLTDVVKLASNENPLGPSPLAAEAIAACAHGVSIYPDGNAPALRAAVSELVSMPPNTLVFGNGSDEILHLLTMTFLQPGEETVQADPSFAMYEIYAAQANAKIHRVPLTHYTHNLEAMADAITPGTRLLFIANPNNPTGTLVTQAEVDRFMERVPPHVLVVFDEAYDEYVSHADKPDMRPYVRDDRNVIILRTFSKAYGLAGLRVGYGIAPPRIAELLNRVRSPFNVNLIGQAAAAAGVVDQEHIRRAVALNYEGRDYYYREFQRLGLEFIPSEANFVCVDVKRDSKEVFEALQRLGVIVRAGAGLGLPTHIRVTVGTMAQNERFIAALTAVLES